MSIRVTSDFFVSALVRRVFSAGGFAAIEKRGSPEAGAIFIRQSSRFGTQTLYGPAPQTVFDEETSGDRRFEIRLKDSDRDAIDALIAREKRYDSDLWLVELEVDAIGDLFAVTTDQDD